ncbi:MAG: T9SS type B sorting domain-containing protein [Chitinophagaceae bacterium]|nr:MAG: T9SS type B sorting domain-containing protein [Chitinophagaceae bacterium]
MTAFLRPLTVLLFLLASTGYHAEAQTCTTPGQNPSTAFPVCGTSSFAQSTVPQCGGRPVGFQHCGAELTDLNPFWYKFTCYQSGTLGFVITPDNLSDDYDWALYDVTGRNPGDVYNDASLTITDNWSADGGTTGCSNAGSQQYVCDGAGRPRFSRMPQLEQGHNYLLLVSHFTRTTDGYRLSFGGGSAVITDTTPPRLKAVEASCGGDILRVKLNKKMKCTSLTAGGTEFFITPAVATVTSARGFGCDSGFDTDSVELRLSTFLSPGSYTLGIRNGSDGNTLLDVCDRNIPDTNKLSFILLPRAPTPMDSLIPVTCAPVQLRLLFRRPMLCSSVAPNGSDFVVNGTYPVSVTAARGDCSGANTVSKEIIVTLSAPLFTEGNFRITLRSGTDGNTVFDECGEETPAGSFIDFSVKDTVNANFTYSIDYGCSVDSVHFQHPGGNRVNSWSWVLGEGQASNLQAPTGYYRVFDEVKNVQLAVTNGLCHDTASATIALINYLKAGFNVLEDQCPNEPVVFTNTSVGRRLQYQWVFGNGLRSTDQNPTPVYATPSREARFNVTLTVTDSFNCISTVTKRIIVYPSCYIDVPNAFTPNNDGRNDYFHILNAVKAVDFELMVYNRWGQVVFQSRNWKEGWDGRVKGIEQNTGTFVWFARYTDRDTGQPVLRKGTLVLIR